VHPCEQVVAGLIGEVKQSFEGDSLPEEVKKSISEVGSWP